MPATPDVAPRPRRTPRRIEVARIATLSPHMVRITFTGEDLQSFVWTGPAAHIKLIVPEDGSHEAPMPIPDGPRSPTMRTYTPRRFNASTFELDVDFMLHDHGPAGRWAIRAKIGDRLVVLGPAPGYKIDAEAAWFLLAGDGTALPAIETILADLPAKISVRALIEVTDENEIRALHSAGNVDIEWLIRGADPQQAGAPLEAAIRKFIDQLPSGNGRFYVGCESNAMRRIRRLLLKERGFERGTIVTRGYWKLGSSNHPDGDYGDDTV
ncbi:MAG: siderophore-interacting protein [Verrucomicrobiaceae bacterium]|nr:siderophore-interacting protein [Verrucomicrobiaceae bacterium]